MSQGKAITFKYVLLCFLGSAFLFSTTHTRAYTLTQAVQQTLATHPEILSGESNVQATRKDVSEAKGGWLPTLDLAGGGGREYSDNPATRATGENAITFARTESEIQASQLIFDGGKVSYTVRQRKDLYGATQFQLAQTEENLAFDAASAYLDVIRYRRLVKIAQSDVKSHEDILRKIELRMKGGAGRISEVDLAKGRLASSKSNLVQQQNSLADANSAFFKVIGIYPPGDLEFSPLPMVVPHDLMAAQVKAEEINPSITAADLQYNASRNAEVVARSAYFPRITFDLSNSYGNNLDGVLGHNNDRLAMLRMTYNLFHGGSDEAAVGAADARKMAALHDAQNTRRKVNEAVAQAWNGLEAAQKKLPYLREHAVESYGVTEAYKKEFILGQRTLFDLLNSQTEYFSARGDYASGKIDVQVQEYRLYATIGILVEVIHYADAHPVVKRITPKQSPPLPPLVVENTVKQTPLIKVALSPETKKPKEIAKNISPKISSEQPHEIKTISSNWLAQLVPLFKGEALQNNLVMIPKESSLQALKTVSTKPVALVNIPEHQTSPWVLSSFTPSLTMPTKEKNFLLESPFRVGLSTTTQTQKSSAVASHKSTLSPPPVDWLAQLAPALKNTSLQKSEKVMAKKSVISKPQEASTYYTLHLLSVKQLGTLKSFAKAHHLKQKARYKTLHLANQTEWYVLLYGQYKDIPSALKAMEHLPAPLKQLRPYVMATEKTSKTYPIA